MSKRNDEVQELKSLSNVEDMMKNILPLYYTIDPSAKELMKSCVNDFINAIGYQCIMNSSSKNSPAIDHNTVVNSLRDLGLFEISDTILMLSNKLINRKRSTTSKEAKSELNQIRKRIKFDLKTFDRKLLLEIKDLDKKTIVEKKEIAKNLGISYKNFCILLDE